MLAGSFRSAVVPPDGTAGSTLPRVQSAAKTEPRDAAVGAGHEVRSHGARLSIGIERNDIVVAVEGQVELRGVVTGDHPASQTPLGRAQLEPGFLGVARGRRYLPSPVLALVRR